ncbi:YciI family protein [Jatrophihabitans sp. YIM 134969]
MRFLLMVQSNATSLARWETLSDEERAAFGAAHYRLTDELMESGQLVVSGGLMGPEAARRVTVRDGEITATDGPFAEIKEHLAGFYLVECADLAEAEAIAARIPDAAFNHVEVRPLWDPKAFGQGEDATS